MEDDKLTLLEFANKFFGNGKKLQPWHEEAINRIINKERFSIVNQPMARGKSEFNKMIKEASAKGVIGNDAKLIIFDEVK